MTTGTHAALAHSQIRMMKEATGVARMTFTAGDNTAAHQSNRAPSAAAATPMTMPDPPPRNTRPRVVREAVQNSAVTASCPSRAAVCQGVGSSRG